MQRRDFLRVGGAGALAWAARPAAAARTLAERPSATVVHCAHPAAPAIDARRLPSGDPRLVGSGIRISVLGLADDAADHPGRAALDFRFPGAGPDVVFHAWAVRDAAVVGVPAAADFHVPIDRGELVLEPSWNEQVFTVTLSTGDDPGVPKLRAGTYRLEMGPAPALVLEIADASAWS